MPSSFEQAARRVLARADELATYTEEPGQITRPLATRAMAGARARVREWMQAAGLETRVDAIGNLAGRRGNARLVIGSHLDSVADAGRYDGILGILIGLEVAAATDLPIEVVAFADEDGLRFQSIYLGSRSFVGELTPQELALRDTNGITLREAITDEPGPPLYDPRTEAYFEVHIEQGPVLEAEGLALGVVTAIAGQSRFNLAFNGHAGHAGTTPMHLRRDAAAAAAEFVLAAERIALDEPGLVATVGEFKVPRGAVNVIPGRADVTLDIRHQDDGVREDAVARLRAETEEITQRRAVPVTWSTISHQPATLCTPALVEQVAAAVEATGLRARRLPSGAGHDTVTMARVTDTAMLFVRCAGGISHHPDESVSVDDVAMAIEAATHFVRASCST
ncbi:M20 family metallo-hydrolase [Solirubrobacter ginsenosidimutans]|uniref:M20 family metallo-hydrolase n=1 Tax=Solirubrobacter ginsenosidimutans TaxID=490573 RepID=A0A9X3S7E2_9ACTN|nr:M20 family metallo-hydrolase [Solirubrobacter ginsenosidimutans]MDA0163453.1 M20 family metallo-hydrolase [Solirubrobacter ginsenosidimutans]